MNYRTQISCCVLIATPYIPVRNRWKRALNDTCIFHHVTELSELRQNVVQLKPSVLFLDLDLPRLGLIKDISEIQRLSTATKIIVLTSDPDTDEALVALEAGARGYCSSDIDSVLIKRALQVVQKGEIWANREFTSRLLKELIFRSYGHELILRSAKAEELSPSYPDGLRNLTNREQEIVSLVGRAASNKEIASMLQITESTVKAHLGSIFRKLGVSDRLRLAIFMKQKEADAKS